MNASIRQDPAKGPGYGILRVTLDAGVSLVDPRFLVQATGLGFLGSDGWTDSEYRHEAEVIEQSGGAFTLRVGPSVVDCLVSGRTYFFRLAESAQRVQLIVEPGLLPSPRESRLSGDSPTPRPPEASKGAAPETPTPQALRPETPVPEAVRKSRLPLFIALAVLILCIAGAAWWFQRDAGAPGFGAGPEISPAQALQEARSLIQRHAPDEDLRAAIDRFSGQKGAEDAAFLLIEDLAPRDAAMRLRYAAYFDPAEHALSGSIQKDPEAARREYRRAQEAGASEAAKALERLKGWAEREAAKGDAQARLLLDNW